MDPDAQINERYTKLQEKLGQLQFEVDNTRDAKIDEIYDRINTAQGELTSIINDYKQQFDELATKYQELSKKVEKQNDSYKQSHEKKLKEVKALEDKLKKKLDEDNKTNRELSEQTLTTFDQQVQDLLQQIGAETKVRNQQVNVINTTLQNDLPSLWSYNVQENQERVSEDQTIVKKASQEISKLFEVANLSKQQREEAEMGMFTMLKEVVVRVKSEMEEERQIRIDGHEAILSILEEAYDKMEETHAKVQQQKAALQEQKS